MIKRKPIKLGIASYLIIVAKTHALLGAQNVFFSLFGHWCLSTWQKRTVPKTQALSTVTVCKKKATLISTNVFA